MQNPEARSQNSEEKKICKSGFPLFILAPDFWLLDSAFAFQTIR